MFEKYIDQIIKENKKGRIVSYKSIWIKMKDKIINDTTYHERLINNKEWGRTAFYKWLSEHYSTCGNNSTGKLIRNVELV